MNQMKVSSSELSSLPPRPKALPAATQKARFVQLSRKTSDGAQRSALATDGPSSSGSVEGVVVRQPSKSRIRRHTNRLSGVFLRSPASSSVALTSTGMRSRKGSMHCADDPSELSNQITAPGILKVFGNVICEGAHYKSVLATTHSSAKELVKEALERYGLNKDEAESYVLCDTIGSAANRQWRTEGFRVVGDNEKPLLLQSLWKPREGLARRFEIQKRSWIEEKTSKDKDTITAGINAQARKLQKSRSRVTMGQSPKLWRSKSEMDLLDSATEATKTPDHDECHKERRESLNQSSVQRYERLRTSLEQSHIHRAEVPAEGDGGAQTRTETLCPSRGEREGEESEREETESSDDNTTQYSIHPPQDCPYLLLLQGCSLLQDFVIYLLAGPDVVFGLQSEHEAGSKSANLLFANDILPRHCRFHRHGAGGPTVLCPSRDALVTRNGEVLGQEVQLSPGDVIGMGRCYLFLFKDPLAWAHKEAQQVSCVAPDPIMTGVSWRLGPTSSVTPTNHAGEMILCDACNASSKSLKGLPFLKSPGGGGRSLSLKYEDEREEGIVREIVAMGRGGLERRPPLTVAFLLCLCVQYSSSCLRTSDLRRLLLLIAGGVQSSMWELTKDLAAAQRDVIDVDVSTPDEIQALRIHDMISGLCPLVVWMSNSLELLQFVQFQLPLILEWRTRKEQDDEDARDALLEHHLSCIRSASEETLAVLEEVIMLAFQQCVYYITKVLYPILPELLDCRPFRDPQVTEKRARLQCSSGLQIPGEMQHLIKVLSSTSRLLSDCQLHPEISSQLIGYLFYFINASLFNSLMERGSEPGFYQWSSGVHMRASLDLLLDWAHTAGLGGVAVEQTRSLSSALNLLATPRRNLLQTSWVSLRSHYPALTPAQLNHLLSLYRPAPSCRRTWTPCGHDQSAAHDSDEILEGFDTHHPLVLPDGSYQFQLGKAVRDSALEAELKEFILNHSGSQSNKSDGVSMGSKLIKADILPEAGLDAFDVSPVSSQVIAHDPLPLGASAPLPPLSPSTPLSSSIQLEEFSSCGALLLTQKLRDLQLQTRETGRSEIRRSALDPSCLLTPPNTPHLLDPVGVVRINQDKCVRVESDTLGPWSSDVGEYDEGGLVFECLSALKVDMKSDRSGMDRCDEEDAQEDHYDSNNDELLSLELERDERGLGLSLIDASDSSLEVKGIFVCAVVPDSPAARCEKLAPGDRILAVNGVSLLGPDYQNGKELIQASGDRLRLLVAKSEWMAQAIPTEH
ncbi:ras-associating and dilute domain-containing protein-like [Brachionichthys hirsutus]|uniref:ras-associating and dilute domain-containing protein-like n=1 Tax=Brachionichthys hirsutus TaxID=412623 RepID=UPI00360461F4